MAKPKKDKKWTAAGAARFAREARIRTTRFLTTPAAERWEVNRLVNAYGYHYAHLGDRDAAMDMLLGMIGYKRPYPRDWGEISAMLLADEAHSVATADLYILSPEMCDVVTAAALTLTLDDLQLITAGDLPSKSGMVILPHPLIVRTVGGDLGDDRAFTWQAPVEMLPRSAGMPSRRPKTGFRLSVYDDANGPVQPDSFRDFAASARAAGTPLPPLILDSIRTYPFSQVITDEIREDLERFTGSTRSIGLAGKAFEEAHGIDENRVIGEYVPGTEIDDVDDLFTVRFLYAFWRLCDQRIALCEQAAVNHSARVTAERAGTPADVRIVQLRRTERKTGNADGSREWHHRWPVRMHKVRQWYPSEGVHRVIYRGPYIKGPEDKPLIGGDTVRGLIR